MITTNSDKGNLFLLQLLLNSPWVEGLPAWNTSLPYPVYRKYIFGFLQYLTHGVMLIHQFLLGKQHYRLSMYKEILSPPWTMQKVFKSTFLTAILPVLELWKQHICLLWAHSKPNIPGSAKQKSIGSHLKAATLNSGDAGHRAGCLPVGSTLDKTWN